MSNNEITDEGYTIEHFGFSNPVVKEIDSTINPSMQAFIDDIKFARDEIFSATRLNRDNNNGD